MIRFYVLMVAAATLVSCVRQKSDLDLAVIAHRGASGYLPENTLEATAMAHAFGADFMEADVQLTKDGVPIVLHDLTLESTTNVRDVFPGRQREDGRFYAVDFDWSEIQKLSAMERRRGNELAFAGRFPIDKSLRGGIPSLEEWIEFVEALNKSRGTKTGIYPEIKSSSFYTGEKKDIVARVLEVLREHGYEEKPGAIFLQSFNPADLVRLKNEFQTKIPLIQLIGSNEWPGAPADYDAMMTSEGLKAVAEYASGIGAFYQHLFQPQANDPFTSSGLVERARELGLKIHVFTHRSDQVWEGLESDTAQLDLVINTLRVDGLFTDHADIVLSFLGRNPASNTNL
jgi:glycerophosphoryl diester phosphodiesterase